MAVLLAFWRILNQENQPNKAENTQHYVKRAIFCILIAMRKEGFMSYSELLMASSSCLFAVMFCASFLVKTNLKSYKWIKLHVWEGV